MDAGMSADGTHNDGAADAAADAREPAPKPAGYGPSWRAWREVWPPLAIAALALTVRAVYLWQYGQTLFCAVPVGVVCIVTQ